MSRILNCHLNSKQTINAQNTHTTAIILQENTLVNFIVYAKLSAHIFQVSGTPSQYKEMGIVPIKFNNLDIIYVLYPCHHMPKSLQDTLGLAPLKRYNKVRSARFEALVWLRIIHKDSGSVQISTILIHHTS